MFSVSPIHLSRGAVGLSALTLLLAGSVVFGQSTYDVQVPFNLGTLTLGTPGGVAVAPDGTVYVTDLVTTGGGFGGGTTTGRVIVITPSGTVGGTSGEPGSLTSSVATLTLPAALTRPTAVAVDSLGDLYVADYEAGSLYKFTAPETSAAYTMFSYPGTGPTALATDASNNFYVADKNGSIYEFAGGATTGGTALGIGSGYKPVGLAVSGTDLIFASDNELYEYSPPATGSTPYAPSSGITFKFGSPTTGLPIGMGFDPQGSLYVLDNGSGDLWQINAALPGSPYQVPFSATTITPNSLAVSSIGNLYISDDTDARVDDARVTPSVAELFYDSNPVNLGTVPAGTASPTLNVNFNVYTAESSVTQYQTVQGDSTGEFSVPSYSGTCTGPVGVCNLQLEATYQSSTPGLRNGVFGYIDGLNNIYAVHVIGTSGAASVALYPGTQSKLATTIYEPQGMAVSGDGNTFFLADEGGINLNSGAPTFPYPKVFAFAVSGGVPSSSYTTVGSFPYPLAVVLDGFGNLYVADYSGYVTVFPPTFSKTNGATTWSGSGTKLNLSGTAALTHPMSLAVDIYNNLYIGDMGSGGVNATSTNPGYIIKVPVVGTPQNSLLVNGQTPIGVPDVSRATRLNYVINGTPVIFPDGLTADSFGNLFIADAGDGIVSNGNVDVVPISTGVASTISIGNAGALNAPSAVAFDAANDLYVLDSYNERILTIPFTYSGSVPTANSGSITLLGGGVQVSGLNPIVTPSSLVVWPNQNTLSVADIGYQPTSGTSSPVQVLTLASQNVTAPTITSIGGSTSLAGINVGNEPITFEKPGISSSAFTLSGCGAEDYVLDAGVQSACTATIDYNGSSTGQSATIVLNANVHADGSSLGNIITVNGPPIPPTPIAQITPGSGSVSSTTGTAVLTNIGGGTLTPTSITVTGGTLPGGGTDACTTTTTNLTNGQSCNIQYSISTSTSCTFFGIICTNSGTLTLSVSGNASASVTYNYTSAPYISLAVPAGSTSPAATPDRTAALDARGSTTTGTGGTSDAVAGGANNTNPHTSGGGNRSNIRGGPKF